MAKYRYILSGYEMPQAGDAITWCMMMSPRHHSFTRYVKGHGFVPPIDEQPNDEIGQWIIPDLTYVL
jgi:hypothetical protein